MKILPLNNYQSNNRKNPNFGMLKVTDATTPKTIKEAEAILTEIVASSHRPHSVADVLNPLFKQDFNGGLEGSQVALMLDQDKLSTYRENGNNIFTFNKEFQNRKDEKLSFQEWFDDAFRNATEVTMRALRNLLEILKEKKEVISEAEAALAAAKEENNAAQVRTYKTLGADFLVQSMPSRS